MDSVGSTLHRTLTILGLAALAAWCAAPPVEASAVVKMERVPVPEIGEVSFEIGPGEKVALIGAAGAGKTTLVRMLSLLQPPTGGRLVVSGEEVGGLSPAALEQLRRRTVGLLPDVDTLDGSATVGENVGAGLWNRGLAPREVEARVVRALDRVRLGPMTRRPLGQLSGAERQRVAVARALVNDPKILVFDEPTAGLDPRTSFELARVLTELGRDVTVVTVATVTSLRGFREMRLGHGGYPR